MAFNHNAYKLASNQVAKALETLSLLSDAPAIISQHKFSLEIKQAKWQAGKYRDTTLEIKKIVASDAHISVHFYSTSIVRATDKLRHHCVCGIWHLNEDGKIDRVWAVVTPLYKE